MVLIRNKQEKEIEEQIEEQKQEPLTENQAAARSKLLLLVAHQKKVPASKFNIAEYLKAYGFVPLQDVEHPSEGTYTFSDFECTPGDLDETMQILVRTGPYSDDGELDPDEPEARWQFGAEVFTTIGAGGLPGYDVTFRARTLVEGSNQPSVHLEVVFVAFHYETSPLEHLKRIGSILMYLSAGLYGADIDLFPKIHL